MIPACGAAEFPRSEAAWTSLNRRSVGEYRLPTSFLQVNDLAKVITHAEMEIPQNPRKIEELGHQGFKTCHFSGLMR